MVYYEYLFNSKHTILVPDYFVDYKYMKVFISFRLPLTVEHLELESFLDMFHFIRGFTARLNHYINNFS